MEPLRVLAVSHAAVVDVNQEPFDALGRAGARVTLVAPRALVTDIRGRVIFRALDGFAGRLVTLPVAIGGYRRWLGGQRGIHLILYRGLRRTVLAERPDVLFVEEEPYSLAAWQCARAAARAKIPFVIHENQNVARRLPPPFEAIRRFVLARAAGVTVRNRAAADLVRGLGFEGPVGELPHAVDPARFAASPSESPPPVLAGNSLPMPGLVVGFVGRLVPEKGIRECVEAVAAARARGVTCSLVVIGDGPLLDEARARAEALSVPAVFTGALPHDEVPSWYGRFDLVAVPSRTTPTWKEQFGRIVIEANAAGVPVVASGSGELPATVASTGGGVVVPEGDARALADAIEMLLRDTDRRRALGAAGKAAVEQRFTPDAVGAELLRFLTEVSR